MSSLRVTGRLPSGRACSFACLVGVAAAILVTTTCVAQQPGGRGGRGGLATGLQLLTQHRIGEADDALATLPTDASGQERASALQIRALIAWRFRQDWEAGSRLLDEALEVGTARSASWSALARLETARGRHDAAREAALAGISVAETGEDAANATEQLARTAISRAEAAFDRSPRQPLDPVTIDWLRESHDRLRVAVRDNPGDLKAARSLMRTSIFLGDGDALLDGWHSYYLTIVGKPDAGVLGGPRDALDALLPGWPDRQPTAFELGLVVLSLVRSGMYREAMFAAETPAWTRGLEPADAVAGRDSDKPGLEETLAYASFAYAATGLTDEYYRRLSLGEADTGRYREEFLSLAKPLWEVIPWAGDAPRLTLRTLIREVDLRFSGQMRGGATAGYQDLHFGHRVIDEKILISQYGHEASLRFVALDGMVSNGFQSWAWDYKSQHGGWANADGITQVRPAYADGGQQVWRILNDSVAFERFREETARETARDWERAAQDPHAFLPGLKSRLMIQGVQRLMDVLRSESSDRDELKRRFIVAAEAAGFASSIVAHEGRHAIDRSLGTSWSSSELEFRAKLSEIAFAPQPRLSFGGIISGNIGDSTPHGQANLRVMEGLVAWMADHAAEIGGLDLDRPLLPQLDLLSDAQLKAAMASMDPLAR